VGVAVAARLGIAFGLSLGAVTVICGIAVCGPPAGGAVVDGGLSGAPRGGEAVSGEGGGVLGS
jgi:hypothetical protein